MGYHSGVSVPRNPAKHTSTFTTLDPALKRGGRLAFERRLTVLTLLCGLPAVGLCVFLLWYGDYSGRLQWTIDLLLVVVWLSVAFNLKQRVIRPLQTLSNILGALREGDYSIRGRRASSGDALGEVMLEVNELHDVTKAVVGAARESLVIGLGAPATNATQGMRPFRSV